MGDKPERCGAYEDRVREKILDMFCRGCNDRADCEVHGRCCDATELLTGLMPPLTTLISGLLAENDKEWGEWIRKRPKMGNVAYREFTPREYLVTTGDLEARLASRAKGEGG